MEAANDRDEDKKEPVAADEDSDLYFGSSLHSSTQSLLDDVLGPATAKAPPLEEVLPAVAEVFASDAIKGKVNARAVREKLEEKFGVSLKCYVGPIRRETARVLNQRQLQGGAAGGLGGGASSSSSSSVEPLSPSARSLTGQNAKNEGLASQDSLGPASQDSLGPASQDSLGPASQDTLGPASQETAVSGVSASRPSEEVDTRHSKLESASPDEDVVPLEFPKRLDARKPGASMPVLLELHGKDINVRGDSGAIGRVSLIDPQGESGEQAAGAGATKRGRGKSKRPPSKKAKLVAAAKRYTQGSALRIDLKGDVYNGVMVPSGVTLLGVAMLKDKVQVQGVWNEFMQCSFKGNVMDGMDGKVASLS